MPFIIVSRDNDTVALVSEQTLATQADAIDAVSSALSVGALDRSGTFLVLDLDRAAPVAVVEVPPIAELPLEEVVTPECDDAQGHEGVPTVESAGEELESGTVPDATAESEPESLLILEDLPPVEVPAVDLPEVGLPELPVEEQADEVDAEPAADAEDPAMSAALDELLAGSRVEPDLEEPVEADVAEAGAAESTQWPWNEATQDGEEGSTPEASAEEEPAQQEIVPDTQVSIAEIVEVVLSPEDESSTEEVAVSATPAEEDSLAGETIIPTAEAVEVSIPEAQEVGDTQALTRVDEDEGIPAHESSLDASAPETVSTEDEATPPEPEPITAESAEPDTGDHPAVAEAEAVLEAAAAAVAVEAEECLADVPGYEAGECDLSQLTCVDCVYVNTCPNKDERAPSTCGSFQWTSV